ncbi:MAG: hypothetical protein IT373_20080 [Polyangiaceae bacterium]|nr:hypothetical protein [Polyangiaceae bacterium]
MTATAREEVRLLRVATEEFQDAVRASSELAVGVIRVLNDRLRKSDTLLAAARAELAGEEAAIHVADMAPLSERIGQSAVPDAEVLPESDVPSRAD